MAWQVIDVSRYQGTIDFAKVAVAGIKGAIIRAGIGSYSTGECQTDSRFYANAEGFTKAGMPLGAYYFTQAKTTNEARAEARYLVNLVKNYNITLPLVFDIESAGRIPSNSKATNTANAIAFCEEIAAAGYIPCVYTYRNFFDSSIDEDALRSKGVDLWVAHYTTASHPEYASRYALWQYSSSAQISGIDGNVDINYCYKDYFKGGGKMATFVPRTTAPSTTDKNWISVKYGGYNHAMVIDSSTGSVLANCCGYVHGRVLELGGSESKLSTGNADSYYNYNDGFSKGQTPKLGAVLCWSCPGKAGHVAIVEAIYSDGTILSSNSNYKGTRFYTKRINPKTWPSGYVFQGYKYPNYSYDSGTVGTPVERDVYKNQVKVLASSLRGRSRPELSDGTILGFVTQGIYNIYETRDLRSEASNGYLWYKIEDDLWIATKEGDWTEYLPKEKDRDYTALLKIGYASSGDLGQITALLDDKGIGYTYPAQGYVMTSVAPSGQDRIDIENLCNKLGVPFVEYHPAQSEDDARIEQLEKEVAALEKANATLTLNNNSLKAQNTELTKQVSTLTGQVNSYSSTIGTLNSQVNTLTSMNSKYTGALSGIKSIVNQVI